LVSYYCREVLLSEENAVLYVWGKFARDKRLNLQVPLSGKPLYYHQEVP
jgi:hypothetical protein